MDCQRVQESILEALAGTHDGRPRHDVDRHLAACDVCTAFLARHERLDAQLERMLAAPPLSARFRPALRSAIRRDRSAVPPDSLPDIVHFASCGAATLLAAALLPVDAVAVVAAGAVLALLTYVPLTLTRSSFEGTADL